MKKLTERMLVLLHAVSLDPLYVRKNSRDWLTMEALEKREMVVYWKRGQNGAMVSQWHITPEGIDYLGKLTPAGRAELAASAEDAPLPDNQRYQAEDKDAMIAELAAKLARAEAEIVRLRALLNSLTPGYMRSV